MSGQVKDVSSWYLPAVSTKNNGVVKELGFELPNQVLARKQTEIEAQELRGGAETPTSFPEVPSLDQQTTDVTPRPVESLLESAGEELRFRTAPIVNPVMEVMDAVNNTTYGFAFDAIRTATAVGTYLTRNAQEVLEKAVTGGEIEGQEGVLLDTPDILQNKSFMANPEDEALMDKGGYYAALGMNLTAAARGLVNNLGRGMVKWQRSGDKAFFKPDASGARLNPMTGKPMTGVEGSRQGITRSISESSMPTEAKVALGTAVGGKVAKELSGSDSAGVQIVGELIGGFFGAANPAKYVDRVTGAIKYADNAVTVPEKTVLDAFDAAYGEDAVTIARRRLRGSSESPYEAELALRADDSPFSPAMQTEDPGILTLERSIAREDLIFQGRVDDQIDQAQFSLAKELEQTLDPQTGVPNWEALEKLMLSKKDDLLLQVDDRVVAAQQELASLLKVYDGDVTKMSEQFTRVYKTLVSDIKTQENNYWSPIVDSGYQMDTRGFKEAIEQIVTSSNSQTKLPVKEFAEYLGMGLMRTSSGWKTVPLSKRGDPSMRGKEVVFPKVSVRSLESPGVLKRIRTNLNEMVRNPNKDIDIDAAVKAQSAAVEAMEGSVEGAPTAIRDAYRAATQFSKKVNKTLNSTGVFPKVAKAADEKKLETLMKGTTQTDMAVVSKELFNLFDLTTPSSEKATSQALKQAEAVLMAKFYAQVDPNDLASFDAFRSAHRDWFKRFPEMEALIKAARAKAVRQGKTIKNRELQAETARNDIFVKTAGMQPNQVMDAILKSSNPAREAARFRKLLGGKDNKEALSAFQEAITRRFLSSTMKNIEARISGRGTLEAVDPVAYRQSMKQLEPLLNTFKIKELKGLQMLGTHLIKVEKALSARGTAEKDNINLAASLLAKIGAVKAVNLLFGSSSIIVSGTASNYATKALQGLGQAQSNKVLQEAFKNPELMKILLSSNITRSHLDSLNSGKFRTGRLMYNILVEKLPEDVF